MHLAYVFLNALSDGGSFIDFLVKEDGTEFSEAEETFNSASWKWIAQRKLVLHHRQEQCVVAAGPKEEVLGRRQCSSLPPRLWLCWVVTPRLPRMWPGHPSMPCSRPQLPSPHH
ncbi:hypothetical protein MATL_G00021210 [Megalops atlanticus]|uniref:Uncharacterized protein n=1 Tax=Megalops atlanticus TaxID=7932 RepID=A0A9D3QMI0_MEGAT|nr:hypothetical protein MATL_G00021210 [Megalops atlanticus]